MKITDITPEQRARALYYYFGWQGGTIHQLARATGMKSQDLLYREHGDERLCDGFSAVRTCDRDWQYWRDVIIGFWITGPLDGQPV